MKYLFIILLWIIICSIAIGVNMIIPPGFRTIWFGACVLLGICGRIVHNEIIDLYNK